MLNETMIEINEDEEVSFSTDELFNINSWGLDLSFREIILMYQDEELLKPELQRKYVWSKDEASRFIESILLGLPVPSIFLAKEKDEKTLIIDGYQRIMTVVDYVNGIFSTDGKVFKLSNKTLINERWRNKAFVELTPEEKRRIKNASIHAIYFEQKFPDNNLGMYQIFERINTGGKTLKSQEIRNCVYQGKFNTMLFEMNTDRNWRKLVGSDEDQRMLDLEMILRYFALRLIGNRKEFNLKQINLTEYLNVIMDFLNNLDDSILEKYKLEFYAMTRTVYRIFGDRAFRRISEGTKANRKFNPAIFDAISLAVTNANCIFDGNNVVSSSSKLKELNNNSKFIEACTKRTTNLENIKTRISLASFQLFGVDYEWYK